jgi:hypothetical protein
MSTLDVHPPIASQTSMSRRRRGFVLALAAAVALMLLIAGVTSGTREKSNTQATALPQQRDLAPTRLFRDPETHALVWTTPGDLAPAADSTPQQPLRPRHPGK